MIDSLLQAKVKGKHCFSSYDHPDRDNSDMVKFNGEESRILILEGDTILSDKGNWKKVHERLLNETYYIDAESSVTGDVDDENAVSIKGDVDKSSHTLLNFGAGKPASMVNEFCDIFEQICRLEALAISVNAD